MEEALFRTSEAETGFDEGALSTTLEIGDGADPELALPIDRVILMMVSEEIVVEKGIVLCKEHRFAVKASHRGAQRYVRSLRRYRLLLR